MFNWTATVDINQTFMYMMGYLNYKACILVFVVEYNLRGGETLFEIEKSGC